MGRPQISFEGFGVLAGHDLFPPFALFSPVTLIFGSYAGRLTAIVVGGRKSPSAKGEGRVSLL